MKVHKYAKRLALLVATAGLLQGCKESIDTSARYVFKEETITSYLSKHDIYSEYYDLLGRVPISIMSETTVRQLLAARGNYTVFAPTNEAIQTYLGTLVEDGLIASPSWDAFTDSTKLDSVRKVVVFNSIIDGGDESSQLYETSTFPIEDNAEFPMGTLNDGKLTLHRVENHVDSLYINGDCPIDIDNRDIPAINGYIHRIHKVIAPKNVTAASYIQDILDNQTDGYLVISRVIQACGLLDTLTKVRDEVYEKLYQTGQIPDLQGMTSWGFAEGSIGYAPKHRKYGFTIFAETDDFWREQGIDPKSPTLLAELKDWIIQNNQYSVDDPYTLDDDYESEENLLNQWVTYHILPMKIPANRLVIHHSEYGYSRSNPYKYSIPVMEFYSSYGRRRLFKLYESKQSEGIYINRFPKLDLERHGTGEEISCEPENVGCRVMTESPMAVVNDIENAIIYPIDAPLSYNDKVRDNMQRNRIRFDGMSMCPEFMNNDIRKKQATEERYQHVYIPSAAIYPYSENMILNEDCKFVYYNAWDYDWCNLYADEMKAVGRFEITFKLPPVPRRGTYELRYRVLANGNRGIGQLYFGDDLDNLPVTDIPMDLTVTCNGRNTGWEDDTDDDDYNAEVDKRMRNNMLMKGEKSICRNGNTSSTARHYVNREIIRHIIVRKTLDPNKTYYMKIKSVLDSDKKEFYMDNLEFVAKEIYDNPETPEDIW